MELNNNTDNKNKAYMETVAEREVAIYWDYENTPLPPSCTPAEATKSIHNAVSKYGIVVERRVYFDDQHSNSSGMELSGFDLVSTPACSSKETLHKRLIADVLTFAWDSTRRDDRRKPCVVLIAADDDYAYALAKLRDRGVQVLVFGKDRSVPQILTDNADVSLSFEKDVLSFRSTQQRQLSSITASYSDQDSGPFANVFFKNLPKLSSVDAFIQFLERDHDAPVQCATPEDPDPTSDWNCSFAHVKFVRPEDGRRLINLAKTKSLLFRHRNILATIDRRIPPSSTTVAKSKSRPSFDETGAVTTADISRFCVCLHNEQTSAAATDSGSTERWVPNSAFVMVLRAASPHEYRKIEMKRRIRALLDRVVSDSYVTVGRRQCGENEGYVGVAWFKNRGLRADLSTEVYLRLTLKGRQLTQKLFQSGVRDTLVQPSYDSRTSLGFKAGACVRFTNLPPSTKIIDFVDFIETTYRATVRCAIIDSNLNNEVESKSGTVPNVENHHWARLQFTTVRDGVRIMCLAITNKIMYLEREIRACIDSSAVTMVETIEKGNPELCYMGTESANTIPESVVLSSPNLVSHNMEKNPLTAESFIFCNCLNSVQKLLGNTELLPFDKCWVPYSTVGTTLQSFPLCDDVSKDCYKEIVKVTRDIIILDGLVEVARRSLGGTKGFVSVSWFDNRGIDPGLSQEFFLRLTAKGRTFFHVSIQRKKNTSNVSDNGKEETACIFFSNLPRSTEVVDLVRYLELDLRATVQQATIEHPVSSTYSNAHVEFMDAKDGLRLIDKEAILEFSSMRIYANIDKNVPQKDLSMENDPMLFYNKNNDSAAIETSEKLVFSDEDISLAVRVLNRCLYEDEWTHPVSTEQCWVTAAAAAEKFRVGLTNETKCIVILSKYGSDEIYRQGCDRSILDGYLEAGCVAHSMSAVSKTLIIPVLGSIHNDLGCDLAESYLRLTLKGRSLHLPSTINSPDCNQANQTLLDVAAFEEDETSTEINTIVVKSAEIEKVDEPVDISNVTNELFSDGRPSSFWLSMSNMPQLLRQLEAAVAAKDVQQVSILQIDINTLAALHHSYPSITSMESNLSLFEKDLSKAVVARDFAEAGSVQTSIERLKKNIIACKAQIQSSLEILEKELEEAIAKRDFPRAGSIQERIETMN